MDNAALDRRVRLGGLQFHYRDWGPSGSPPIVVLHGLGHDAAHWNTVASALAPDHRVLVLDQRGSGQTEWTSEYSFAHLCDDLTAFIAALGLHRITLVGHSMGGTVAYLYAVAQPLALRRLVIVDTAPPDPGRPYKRRPIPPAEYATFDEALRFMYDAAPDLEESWLRSYLLESLTQLTNGRWRWRFDPALMVAIGRDLAINAHRIWGELHLVSVPTLLLWARNSFVSRANMDRVAAVIPSCRVVEIPDSAHDVPADNPAALASSLHEFLSSQ